MFYKGLFQLKPLYGSVIPRFYESRTLVLTYCGDYVQNAKVFLHN